MRESEADSLLRHLSPNRSTPRSCRPLVIALTLAIAGSAITGVAGGWFLHNSYWRKSEVDYSLARAIAMLARCKDLPYADLIRNIEVHIARPRAAFQLDDKLVALDYVFDQIEAARCIQPSPPKPTAAWQRRG